MVAFQISDVVTANQRRGSGQMVPNRVPASGQQSKGLSGQAKRPVRSSPVWDVGRSPPHTPFTIPLQPFGPAWVTCMSSASQQHFSLKSDYQQENTSCQTTKKIFLNPGSCEVHLFLVSQRTGMIYLFDVGQSCDFCCSICSCCVYSLENRSS